MGIFRRAIGRLARVFGRSKPITPDDRASGVRSVRDDPAGTSLGDERGRTRGMGI